MDALYRFYYKHRTLVQDVMAVLVFGGIFFGASLLCGQALKTGSTPVAAPATPTATKYPPDAVVITIMTADTKAEWLKAATESFNKAGYKTSQNHPIYVEMQQEKSPGDNDQAIKDGTFRPTIWSPGEISPVDLANQLMRDQGKPLLVTEPCTPTVYAATGFAMWRPMAEALGWPDEPIGWDQIAELAADPQGWATYGHPEWGTFKFGHSHPEYSTTGLTMLATLAYNELDRTEGLTPELVRSDSVREAFKAVETDTYHYGLSTRRLMELMAQRGPSYLHAVTSSETSTLKTNDVSKDQLAFPLVFIFPAEGAFWMDNPFCIMNGAWVSPEQHEAARLYFDYLMAPAQQDLAVTIGLRPANPAVALHAPIDLAHGTDPRANPRTIPPLAAIDGSTRSAIIDLFKETKKKATLIVLLDTSGSMQGNKLSAAIDGTVDFLHRLAKEDDLYFYHFDTKVTPLQPSGRAGKVIEQLEPQIKSLGAGSGTALYQAICDAVKTAENVRQVDQRAGEQRLYGVVVLTDGQDGDSKISLDTLLNSCLPSGEDVSGIKIYTIAYGGDANEQLLKQIAAQTNGKMFTSTVNNIREIYLNISAEQ